MEQWVEENGVNRDRCIVRKRRNGIGRALWARLWAAFLVFGIQKQVVPQCRWLHTPERTDHIRTSIRVRNLYYKLFLYTCKLCYMRLPTNTRRLDAIDYFQSNKGRMKGITDNDTKSEKKQQVAC